MTAKPAAADKAEAPTARKTRPKPAVEPLTYDTAEAAIVIGCSKTQVLTLVRRGLLPKVPHMGRPVLIPRVAVHALVDSAMGEPTKDQVRAALDSWLSDDDEAAAS